MFFMRQVKLRLIIKQELPLKRSRIQAFPYYGSNIQKQTRYILNNIQSVFEAAGCDFKDVVKAQVFLTDLNELFITLTKYGKSSLRIAVPRTIVEVQKLLVPGCKIETDLWGVLPNTPKKRSSCRPTMKSKRFAIGTIVNDTLYAGGQIASDHKTPPLLARQDAQLSILRI
jgi:enamine deaminase RidA (YjgF/YER057c/UK114 family)